MSVKENIERMRELSRQAELGGGEDRQRRQRESGRLTARERVEFLLDRRILCRLDKFKTHRMRRLRNGRAAASRATAWSPATARRGRQVCVFSQDFTVFGGSLGARSPRSLQGDGPRDEDRMPRDWTERFGRRAHPGGRGVARRLCRHLSAQRDGLGRGAADFLHHGAVRRRCSVLACDDRLRSDGARYLVHVHHRPRRDQGDHARRSLDAGSGRRRHAFDPLGRMPFGSGRRPERAARGARLARVHAAQQRR